MQSTHNGKARFFRYGAIGSPDIIGVFRGKFLGIEVKTERGKLTALQEAFLERINAEGGIAIVARSLEDVIDALDNI